jgi:hypothetical protein
MKMVLVFQGGLANVFKVDRFSSIPERRGHVVRLAQTDFRSAEWFATGAGYAGAKVRTAHCDQHAGDATNAIWQAGRGELFREKRNAVVF